MKKLKPKQREWELTHRRYAEKRKRVVVGQPAPSGYQTPEPLNAPIEMCLDTNYRGVIEFLFNFRERIDQNKQLTVDLKPIKILTPGAALILAAELDRWRKIKGIRLRPYKQRQWDQQIRRQLSEMGLFELLQLKGLPRFIEKGPVRFIKFISGNDSDGMLAVYLLKKMGDIFPASNPEYSDRLYDALSEAMTNVVQHAYPENYNHPYEIIDRQFWLSGSFNNATRRVNIMFYDQGVGIPKTLPSSGIWARCCEKIPLKSDRIDANLIEVALEVGETRTKEEHRGTGLQVLVEFSKKVEGELRIISGSGEVIHNTKGKKNLKKNHQEPFFGTFIEWSFNLDISN